MSDFDKFNYIATGQMDMFQCMAEQTDNKLEIRKRIKLIELFAGYGSQALGLKRIGANFDHHFVCEFDKYAVKSYNAVHGTDFPTIDIREVHAEDLHVDEPEKYLYFLTYSFPCTDLSVAGAQKGMSKADWEAGKSTRSGLLWEVERILKESVEQGRHLPQLLMMENVPQVHGKKAIEDFKNWIAFLDSIGYVSFWQDLNAKDYGIPQNRLRTYMFSFLKSEFGDYVNYEFPDPIPFDMVMGDLLEDKVDEKYYINSDRAKVLIENLIKDGTLDG